MKIEVSSHNIIMTEIVTSAEALDPSDLRYWFEIASVVVRLGIFICLASTRSIVAIT